MDTHSPLKYQLSLNLTATNDHFDLSENILTTVTNSDAADPSNVGLTGSFSTTMTIPASALDTYSQAGSDNPCVLQLWDIYYFVSCANVLLAAEDSPPNPTPTILPPLPPTQAPATLLKPFLYNIITSARLRSVSYNPEGNSTASFIPDGTLGLLLHQRIYQLPHRILLH